MGKSTYRYIVENHKKDEHFIWPYEQASWVFTRHPPAEAGAPRCCPDMPSWSKIRCTMM